MNYFLIGIVIFLPVSYVFLRLILAEMAKTDSLVTNGETGKAFGITKSKSSNDVDHWAGNLKGTGKHVELDGEIKDGEGMVFGSLFKLFVYKYFGVFWIGFGGVYRFNIGVTDIDGNITLKNGAKFISYNGERFLSFKDVPMKGRITGDFIIRFNDQVKHLQQMVVFKWTTQIDQSVRAMFLIFAATRSIEEMLGKQEAGVADDKKTNLDEVIDKSNYLLDGKGVTLTQVVIEKNEVDKKTQEAAKKGEIERLNGLGRIEAAEQDLKVQEIKNKQTISVATTKAATIRLENDALAEGRKKKFDAVDKNPNAFVGAETAEAIKENKTATTLAINANTALGIPTGNIGKE